mmetsp:Transcript_10239/g.17240  ORF Transcript_10239/g.17240 Transcript_10239/m.17240 type:complete len:197 (-) Transcript_10239:55-645(-)
MYIYACLTNPACPEYQVVQDFQIQYFTGQWYEMYRTRDNEKFEGQCNTLSLEMREFTDVVKLTFLTTEQDESLDVKTYTGKAKWPEFPKGIFDVKYSPFSPKETFAVLETDYTNYAICYTCFRKFGAWRYENLQVFTKQPPVEGTKLFNAYTKVAKAAIKRGFDDPEVGELYSDTQSYLKATKHSQDLCIAETYEE